MKVAPFYTILFKDSFFICIPKSAFYRVSNVVCFAQQWFVCV